MAFRVMTKTISGTAAQSLISGTMAGSVVTGATHVPARWAIVNNVSGNGNLTVGDKNVTATIYGSILAAAASLTIGPFSGELPFNLEDIWLIGTDTNVIRVTFVT